jgi:hypothetical protein
MLHSINYKTVLKTSAIALVKSSLEYQLAFNMTGLWGEMVISFTLQALHPIRQKHWISAWG